MGCGNEDTGREQRRPAGHRAGVVDPGDPFDVQPGPEGWELYRTRAFWSRVEQAEAEAEVLDARTFGTPRRHWLWLEFGDARRRWVLAGRVEEA